MDWIIRSIPSTFCDSSVKDIGTDFLLCSSYKFFGPRLGIIYCKKEVGETLETTRVLASDNTEMPETLETGTLSMELVHGAAEAVQRHEDQLEAELAGLTGMRRRIVAGMKAFEIYEEALADALRAGLSEIQGLKLYGPGTGAPRTSTVSFTIEGHHANDIAKFLAEKGLYVWDGDFYAIATINSTLGLEPAGGLVRVGFAPYNLMSDVERVIAAVKEFVLKK